MTQLGFAINHPGWRDPTVKYMRAFLEYAETHYGDRISAYLLACGGTDEWQDRTHGQLYEFREAAFIEWNEARGDHDITRAPRQSVRHRVAHDILRDPVEDRATLEYLHFLNNNTVDTIQYFVGEARKIIRSDAELGVFYGYVIELAHMRHNTEGYLRYERLAETPGLDFLIGPGTYQDRKIGGGSGFMVPRETLRLRGLQYMHENDQRTHTSNFRITKHLTVDWERTWPDETSTIAGIKRELAMCVAEKTSMWWFDMWGGFYQGERVMATFRRLKEIWDRHSTLETQDVTEILMVVDPESCYYFDETNRRVNDFILATRNKLNRAGAPYRICSFDDLELLNDLARYRLIVFPNAVLVDDARRAMLARKVFRDQRSVLWLYGPGIVDGACYREDAVRELCGAPFKAAGLQKTDMGDWRSIYLHDPSELTPATLKHLAEDAGATVYCDQEVPVYANSRFVAIHSAQGGETTIKLPHRCRSVEDLFSRRTVARDTDVFTVQLATPDTVLFELSQE
jgi:hypothetical protein